MSDRLAKSKRSTLTSAVDLLLKNPKYLFQRINHYGIGRLILERTKFHPTVFSISLTVLRVTKIFLDPLEYIQRRKLAKIIVKDSNFRNRVLIDTGYAMFPPGTFEAVENILPIANSIYEKFLEKHPSGRKGQSGYSSLLTTSPQSGVGPERTDLRAYPEFQTLAHYKPFLEIACDYLGEFPILAAIDLQVVSPNPSNQSDSFELERGPKDFHIDSGGKGGNCLKCFIALEDVDQDNGGTIVLNRASSRKLAKEIGYRQGRIPDEIIFREPWRQQLTHLYTLAGGVYFLDSYKTFHCGTRATNRPRILINLMYASKYLAGESELQRNRYDFDHRAAKAEPYGRFLFNL